MVGGGARARPLISGWLEPRDVALVLSLGPSGVVVLVRDGRFGRCHLKLLEPA